LYAIVCEGHLRVLLVWLGNYRGWMLAIENIFVIEIPSPHWAGYGASTPKERGSPWPEHDFSPPIPAFPEC
jgi:hypothetical protein